MIIGCELRPPAASGGLSYAADLPASLRGRWCVARLARQVPDDALVRLHVEGPAEVFGRHAARFLRRLPGSGARFAIVFVAADYAALRIELFGVDAPPPRLSLSLRAVSRPVAAALLMAARPREFARALQGGGGLRRAMARIATRPPAPGSYADWVRLFDSWPPGRLDRLLASPRRAEWPRLRAVVFGDPASPAHAATMASLAASVLPADADGAAYLAILQAGEVVPPHALALAADEIVRRGRPALLLADEDSLDASGARTRPRFKPTPGAVLMRSGTQSGGLWLVRRDIYEAYMPQADHADVARRALFLALAGDGRGAEAGRIAHVLTHRRPDTAPAPPSVDDAGAAPPGPVCLIVPTGARKPHVARCLEGVLATTDWPELTLLLVVTQPAPPDAAQLALLARVLADPRVRLLHNPAPSFNYAAANNFAALQTEAATLCLLNDDVLPMRADWLAAMHAHLADPGVAAVGAKLYFPDRTVQHAGIVMGLGGLCEHAFRYLPQGQPGPDGRAVLDHEVSAVTGACLLVRAAAWHAVGGLDEVFATGFNDVDFCMRLRASGHRIVQSARAELFHYESQTFIHHYAEAADRELADAQLIWARWGAVCRDDPYYNPNLSLDFGADWQPAFPPRHPG